MDISQFRTDRAYTARRYDYFLSGKDNFEVDRQAGDEVITIFATAKLGATANREFMRRAVRHLVHQLVPEARVGYVDNDPVVPARGCRTSGARRCRRVDVCGGRLRGGPRKWGGERDAVAAWCGQGPRNSPIRR